MHPGFECYRALPEDIRQDKKAFGNAKLTMPVLAIGGDKGFADWDFTAMQQVATNVKKPLYLNADTSLRKSNPKNLWRYC